MNPDTNRFETLRGQDESSAEQLRAQLEGVAAQVRGQLLRPDGTPVPQHWTVLTVGELVDVKGYTFRVAHINESTLLLEPMKATDIVVGGGGR